MKSLLSTLAIVFNRVAFAAHNILDFGAIPSKTDIGTEYGNAAAFHKAVMFAHNHKTDKEVLIPANLTFSMVPAELFSNVTNVTITVNGTVLLSEKQDAFPPHTGDRFSMW
jgi:hypothetical protein